MESGKQAAQAPGVLDARESANGLSLQLGSGSYSFYTAALPAIAKTTP
jgi:hypothetical protein